MTVDPRLRHFAVLTQADRERAILRLIDAGMPDTSVAAAAGVALETVRSIVGRRREAEARQGSAGRSL